jgi:nitric oxide reductase NorD protein
MLFEPEETVGWMWHRWVGDAASYRRHPDAAATLGEMRAMLAVLFRALGGEKGVRIVPASGVAQRHRLGLRQRIGVGRERLARPALDGETLQLPPSIDCFPDRADNRLLYEWLVAWLAHAGTPPPQPADALQADIATLRHATARTARTLGNWPGLRGGHARLAASLDALRPRRARGLWERRIEDAVSRVLTGGPDTPPLPREDAGAPDDLLDDSVPLSHFTAPPGYRPFLPVPLWGEVRTSTTARNAEAENIADSAPGIRGDSKRRRAARRKEDRERRGAPLALSRFESLLASAELVDADREVEDDDAESAQHAAEELDELAIGEHDRRPAASLKLDLDLAPASAEATPLRAELTYPEWDYRRRIYHPDHCRVIAESAAEEGEDWTPDESALRRIRQVRRHFEAFRPRRQVLPAQADGDELDLSALVRARADLRAGNAASDRIYLEARNAARDLAVAVLVDVSLSTEGAIDNRRVLDVEKEALTALALGLRACGDAHAVFTFTSRKRRWVSVRTVKDFGDTLNARTARRIRALKPGSYTRMGAAIRHVASRLEGEAHRHRLLLLLTDGKPNDIDHYEGRYAVEDTRMAIRETRRRGIKVFGITVDEHAREYFPYIFGRGAYAIFPHVERLTAALPAMYRQLAA